MGAAALMRRCSSSSHGRLGRRVRSNAAERPSGLEVVVAATAAAALTHFLSMEDSSQPRSSCGSHDCMTGLCMSNTASTAAKCQWSGPGCRGSCCLDGAVDKPTGRQHLRSTMPRELMMARQRWGSGFQPETLAHLAERHLGRRQLVLLGAAQRVGFSRPWRQLPHQPVRCLHFLLRRRRGDGEHLRQGFRSGLRPGFWMPGPSGGSGVRLCWNRRLLCCHGCS